MAENKDDPLKRGIWGTIGNIRDGIGKVVAGVGGALRQGADEIGKRVSGIGRRKDDTQKDTERFQKDLKNSEIAKEREAQRIKEEKSEIERLRAENEYLRQALEEQRSKAQKYDVIRERAELAIRSQQARAEEQEAERPEEIKYE